MTKSQQQRDHERDLDASVRAHRALLASRRIERLSDAAAALRAHGESDDLVTAVEEAAILLGRIRAERQP